LREAESAGLAQARAKRNADIALIEERYPDALSTPSGLRYIIQEEGSGPKPETGKTVVMNYKGMFLSGEVFDSSDLHGGALEFQAGAGRMIPGWEEAALDMRQGERRLVIIPPELAYGERGAGNGLIPGNTFLIFEMELAGIR
ncbi:MAG: FKBP-type peptidyl-prolyl cis-trans isomerase, partial [Spirochaetaceae bacterium]|nr:FKBP-type peptidyl-prolyl cis-trans isomerase [Spirochaetaceae bacterium]